MMTLVSYWIRGSSAEWYSSLPEPDLHNAAMMDSASSMGASSMAESTDTMHGPGSPAVAVAQQGSELLAGERPLEMSDPDGPRGQRHKRQQYADGGSNITQP